MKKAIVLVIICLSVNICIGQTKKPTKKALAKETLQVVEASCGECKFGIKGNDCDLAVQIKGKAYFVDRTKIDDHGDAHANDDFCEKIRKAEVKGSVVNKRFFATYFKLFPEETGKN